MKKQFSKILPRIIVCLTFAAGFFFFFQQQAIAQSLISIDFKEVHAKQANGCYAPECLASGEDITFSIKSDFNSMLKGLAPELQYVRLRIKVDGSKACAGNVNMDTGEFSCSLGNYKPGIHHLEVIRVSLAGVRYKKLFDNKFSVCDKVNSSLCTGPHNMADSVFQLCNQINEKGGDGARSLKRCQNCFLKDGIWTAIGCVPTDAQGILRTTIKLGLFSGGGFALIMILFGAFNLSISQGDPKKVSESKDIITAAIIGLIFIIFSVSILQFIGVEILRIPGFGT